MLLIYFIILMTIPLMMTTIGFVWRKKPPKAINWVYGYRTSKSMKNQETWEFANKYFGNLWYKIGIALSIISIIVFCVFINSTDLTKEKVFGLWIILQSISLLIPIIPTEISLKKNFDKNGNLR
ncbi:MAG: SdpI family protein [Firmicutes bacterium]|nr:SdpI family protein [Bacillota bacterium]